MWSASPAFHTGCLNRVLPNGADPMWRVDHALTPVDLLNDHPRVIIPRQDRSVHARSMITNVHF